MATLAAPFNTGDQTTPGYYGTPQTALLLLDFHSMFIEKAGGPQAPAALQTAARLRTWAKSQGIKVIHCLIDPNLAPYPTCKGSERLTNIVGAMKSGGGDEPGELLEGSADITFARRPGHVSALKSPGLKDFLHEKGIKSLVLTGLSTSGCVMRTAIASTDEEFVVTVISDGCADAGEDVHDMILGKVLNNRGFVTTASQFQEGFAKAHQ